MSLTNILIAAAVIIVGLPIALAFGGAQVDSFFQTQQDRQDARDFGNNPQAGDIVCDLKIHVEGQLDFDRTNPLHGVPILEAFQIGNLEVYMGSQGGFPATVDAVWTNCHRQGTFSFASFFGNIERLALVQGSSFDLQMNGISKSNMKPLTENSNTKVWKNKVEFTTVNIPIIELSSTDLPVSWQTDYFLTNVKIDDYQLRFIAVGGSINNLGTNIPLTFDVDRPIVT